MAIDAVAPRRWRIPNVYRHYYCCLSESHPATGLYGRPPVPLTPGPSLHQVIHLGFRGTSLRAALRNACLLTDLKNSCIPMRQYRRVRRQNPGNVRILSSSLPLTFPIVYPSLAKAKTALGPASVYPRDGLGEVYAQKGECGIGDGVDEAAHKTLAP